MTIPRMNWRPKPTSFTVYSRSPQPRRRTAGARRGRLIGAGVLDVLTFKAPLVLDEIVSVYDVIVIGVGGMGSAAVYHLARRGSKVLGLEQYDIPHEFGSSHGITRIIRLAYAEHANYVPLLRRAYELWRGLRTRQQNACSSSPAVSMWARRDSQIVQGSLQSCSIHHLPYELMDAAT